MYDTMYIISIYQFDKFIEEHISGKNRLWSFTLEDKSKKIKICELCCSLEDHKNSDTNFANQARFNCASK